MIDSDLPPPSAEAAAHGARVAGHVADLIDAAAGAIPFGDYMDAVLYAPGLGYYSAGARKFGEGGDFTTAPEASPLFARAVAREYAALGFGDFLELGGGSGRFAADCLVELARLDALPPRYWLLEVSADLRDRQRATLEALAPALIDRVEWLDRLPASFDGLVFANEVLDALPFERFRRTASGVDELTVIRRDAGFGWGSRPAPPALAAAVADIEADLGVRLPDGHESEVCLRLGPWLASLAQSLGRGAVLLFDYGMSRREYYSPQRARGTLRCHYRQRAHDDPFVWPGLQDVTAQVDFTAVAAHGVAAGLDFAGYTTQAHALLGLGLGELMDEEVDAESARVRAQQARMLTLPDAMGERFKAIGFTRGVAPALRAFSVRDLSARL